MKNTRMMESGVALISVLLLVVIVTVLSVSMIQRLLKRQWQLVQEEN